MITVTVTSENEEPFTVRFQSKQNIDASGVPTWGDNEVVGEKGKSQRYGIDENFRLVIEAMPANA